MGWRRRRARRPVGWRRRARHPVGWRRRARRPVGWRRSAPKSQGGRRPKVTGTVARRWPSQAPQERPNWAFPASHPTSTEWAGRSLATRPNRKPSTSCIMEAWLGPRPGNQTHPIESSHLGPCLVLKKFYKIFQILRHIKFCGICMEH